MTKNSVYLEEAIKCGEITWKRGLLHKGYGLCHGIIKMFFNKINSLLFPFLKESRETAILS